MTLNTHMPPNYTYNYTYHNDKYIGEYAGKYIVYEEHHVKKNYYEQLFINICIYIVCIAYIYEVIMFINRAFIRR